MSSDRGAEHRSRFGGLWTDRHDALELLEQRAASGALSEAQTRQLRHWIEEGYVVIPGAVSSETVERVLHDVESAWSGAYSDVYTEVLQADGQSYLPPRPEHRGRAYKLLNLHSSSSAARDALFCAPILAFLELVFERPPLAFQTLYLERGSQQPIHQDTAFVGVSSPMELVASWIALEPIHGRCGKLQYFPGSQRLEELVFENGQRLMPEELQRDERYPYHLLHACEQLGLELESFEAQKGDAFLWSADLVHGGSSEVDEGRTRRSLVTHYCPLERDPGYCEYWSHSERLPHESGGQTMHFQLEEELDPEL